MTVRSGARSLRSREHGETFHPVVGPMAEARELHVRPQRLPERAREHGGRLVVWDIGLGAAANAVAVLEECAALEPGARIELHSFDCTIAPLAFALTHAEELGYLLPWREEIGALLRDRRVVSGAVEWFFHEGDFRETIAAPPAPTPQAIIYDPYSPTSNPGMWSLEHFTRLRAALSEPCTLTSYSRSTAVRATLLLAGFCVGRGGATGEKDETTIAATRWELLAQPLDAAWLETLRRSTKGAPLRVGETAGPIAPEDFAQISEMLAR